MPQNKINMNGLFPEGKDEIRRKLVNVNQLPTISTVFEKIISLVEDERSSAHDLEKIIKLDQAITARVLKLINSPMYGYSNISSVSHAITLLGFNTLKNVALSASITNVFDWSHTVGEVRVDQFWLHSIGVAYLSKLVAEKTGICKPDEIFTLGLLHDIGKLMYLNETPEFFQRLLETAKNNKISLNRLEREIGFSHSQLGWLIAEKWNVPEKVCAVLKKHHNVQEGDQYIAEEAVVNFADYVVHRIKLGQSGNSIPDPPSSLVVDRLSLSPQAWEGIKKNLKDQRRMVEQLAMELLS